MAILNLTVTDQMREDQLVTALEGGSNDWYLLGEDATKILDEFMHDENGQPIPIATAMLKAAKAGKSIPVRDIEAEEDDEEAILGYFNMASIEAGEQKMADQQPEHFMDMWLEEGDAATADVWFQFIVVGSLTYS